MKTPSDCRQQPVSRRRVLRSLLCLPLLSALPVLAKNRENTLSAPRVIVVGGALAECVVALGGQDSLVATDITATYPSELNALPKVGYQRALSAEGILSLHPDLLIATSEAGPANVLAQCRDAGVQVVTLDEDHTVDSVREKLKGVAAALNKEYALSLAKFDKAWAETQTFVTHEHAPRVMFVMGQGSRQPMVAGRDTAADAMLSYAGAINVFGSVESFKGYRPLTPEAATAAAPDLILTTHDVLHATGGVTSFVALPGIAMTPAGQSRRIVTMDTLFLLGFGPRLPEAVRELAGNLRVRV